MKIQQIMTLQSHRIFSTDMHATTQVVEVALLRHAGDCDAKIVDSWFVELKVFVSPWRNPSDTTSPLGEGGCILVAQNSTMNHGWTFNKANQLAHAISSMGVVNLKDWHKT